MLIKWYDEPIERVSFLAEWLSLGGMVNDGDKILSYYGV